MAKVTAPLFSLRASGKFANAIIYVCGHVAKFSRPIPEDKDTGVSNQNYKFLEGVTKWNALTDEIKNNWKDFGTEVRDSKKCIGIEFWLTGYQLFQSYYMKWGENGWPDYPNPGDPPAE